MASANTNARRIAESASAQLAAQVSFLKSRLAEPTVASTKVTDAKALFTTARTAAKASKVTEKG